MSTKPRVGIERKILTSILWVAILPVLLALIVGYTTARIAKRDAVKETLEVSVQMKGEGLQRDIDSRLAVAARLGSAPWIVDLLGQSDPGPGMGEQATGDLLSFAAWLGGQSLTEEDYASVLTLYDPLGTRLYTTGNADDSPAEVPLEDQQDLEYAQFSDFNMLSTPMTSTVIAPVRRSAADALLGYLTIRSGVSSMLQYSIVESKDAASSEDSYQSVLMLPGGMSIVTRLSYDADNNPIFDARPASDSLTQELLKANRDRRSFHLANYTDRENGPAQDVLMAYFPVTSPSFQGVEIYFTAYRPTSAVYSTMNRWALFALLVCILFIGGLCLKAYRDVHNDIVRPVSLLNEGAQIIRQGDYDLKLKISTGDEIEELASSFNKMAAALSLNIEQLETSEERHRSLVTSMRDGIYQTDSEGLITFLNPSGVAILGFDSFDQATSQKLLHMFIEPLDFEPLAGEVETAESQERSRVWMKRWDGETICVEISRTPLLDDAGATIGMEGIIRDVTKRVELEEEARQRSERISAINKIANVINSSLEAGRLYESLIVELKKLIDFDYASVALLSDSGIEFGGRQLWPEEEIDEGYTFTLDGQHSYAAWVARERRFLLVDDFHDAASPFKDQFPAYVRSCLCVPLYATGRIIGTLNLGAKTAAAFPPSSVQTLEEMAPHLAVAIRNAHLLVNLQLSLEEVTRAREKLFAVNEELKTLDELKTNLLSNVSHELRTPLVSVMGYTDMLLSAKAGPINNMQQEYLEISLRNVEKLVTLIENLLDFSRLHRGDERLLFDTFDLLDCAKSSIQLVQPLADARKITVELHAPGSHFLVDGDKGKMGQIFNNLLSNSVKFNHNEGRVDIELKLTQNNVEVIVRDTGIGIPKDALEKVFTRFYQYDGSSTRKYGGTGIGLAIAQDIARLHGSSITATSEPGEGSEFRFTLALATSDSREDEERSFSVLDDTHVLVELLSGDRALSAQVRDVLNSEGIDMIHAESVEDAIVLAERHNPGCILVDVNDLAEDGPLLDALLEDPQASSLPIVLLTNDSEIHEKYRSSVSARVARSFRKSTILSGIHNALTKEMSRDEPIGNKVLCIDDDPEILTFMTRCLGAEGYEVDQCETGPEALDKVTSRDYGLVLLDIAMPGMDGWETCQKIKADSDLAGIKIYFVTAKPIDRNMRRMRESGADGFLLKPFRPEDLIQLVQGLEIRAVAK